MTLLTYKNKYKYYFCTFFIDSSLCILVIPSWGIAVMVVGVVGLVFLFFCGCGLYFGLKKNRKGEVEYEGQNETFDKMHPG